MVNILKLANLSNRIKYIEVNQPPSVDNAAITTKTTNVYLLTATATSKALRTMF